MCNLSKGIIFFFILFFLKNVSGQLVTENILTPEELVQTVLSSPDITISNVEFNHSAVLANTIQMQVGYFNAVSTELPIIEGLILATGNVSLAEGPNDAGGATNNEGVATDPDDADLAAISTVTVNNECILEFDVVTTGALLSFEYVFGGEEYHEFATSSFNDVFGFFVSGPGISGPFSEGATNIALIPGTSLPVTMNNVNNGSANMGPCVNCEYLIETPDMENIQYDSYTVAINAEIAVLPGETYHVKIAIGDAADQSLDSGIFLRAGTGTPCLSETSFSNISTEVCGSYIAPSGNAIFTETGIYRDTLVNAVGCDSIITIDLTVNDSTALLINNDITTTGITLTAVLSDANYQWLDCNAGFAALAGETGQSFTPSENGSYAVLINEFECYVISECLEINTIGIREWESTHISVFPNPTNGGFVMQFTDLEVDYVNIWSANGKLVYSKDNILNDQLAVNLEVTNGVYFVQISTKNKEVYKKLIVE